MTGPASPPSPPPFQPLPPLADPEALVAAMSKVHRRLAGDLRERAADRRVEPWLRDAHAADRGAGRTGEAYEVYREAFCDQVAASWVLCSVFARTLEDRGYLPHRLAGPGAGDRRAQFRAQLRFLQERDYLLHVFDAIALLPGGREVFGSGYAPLWRLGPSSRAIGELLDELGATVGGQLRFTFGRPAGDEREHDGASTRYLGDLYQDLSEDARKRYALLQTPEFVERFLLENTLDPAIEERGVAVTVLDPACGSGHLLLGAYDRLFEARRRVEPGLPAEESARKALSQVFGVDLNPYAAAIARFRLLLSYLDKAGIPRLEAVPRELGMQVYVGDSLLAGMREVQETLGDHLVRQGQATEGTGFWRGVLLSFFDAEADRLLAKTRFDVVVANPPYITEKDDKKREVIRKRYKAAAGAFSLAAPFVERIFQLGNEGAFTGQITSNSFMKREFGKKLIEEVLPPLDLTEVIDTSGAYIPGHSTPTVILFGRAQKKVGTSVRVVMGNRGEPTTPEFPAQGKVWSSITTHHRAAQHEDDYISIADIDRDKLAHHPWSLGGGGATATKELLEARASKRLADIVTAIGRTTHTGDDSAFVASADFFARMGAHPERHVPLVVGEQVRDYSIAVGEDCYFPYSQQTAEPAPPTNAREIAYMWPLRTSLRARVDFGQTIEERGHAWWEQSMFFPERYLTPLSIAFAFVATHNHFVLDRGGKVFNRTAPAIKLPPSTTEGEHLTLLGYLNSSTACFWMKQVFYPKATSVGDISIEKGKPENNRYEFTGTGLMPLPIPAQSMENWGRRLESLGTDRAALNIRIHIDDSTTATILHRRLAHLVAEHTRLTEFMISAQEELDWAVYEAFRLCDRGQPCLDEEQIRPEHRPFAWEGSAPRDLPASVAERYRVRRGIIETNASVRQIESPVFKRLWLGTQGVFGHNTASFRERQLNELWSWLLDRAESFFRDRADPRPLPIRALAHDLHADPKVRAVAEVLTGTSTYDLEAVLGDLLQKEAVPSATCQVYTDAGIENRRLWERTWELQRLEDAGQKVTIDVPPKYDQKDFENASVVWRHRGKLDVPKERFIAYPTASPPPGASGSAALVFGWAGWDHQQKLQAAIELWQQELDLHGQDLIPRATRKDREESLGPAAASDDALRRDAAARERLMPLLQTMADLLPWVRQWHNDDGETAPAFEAYVAEQARRLEVSLDEARAYRRPARTTSRVRATTAAAPAGNARKPAASGPLTLFDGPDAGHETFLEAVRARDTGEGVGVTELGKELGLSAAALKKTVDALVEAGRLAEKKKRPRLVSAKGEDA